MSETIDSEAPVEGVTAALTAWLSISQPVEAAAHRLETTLSERHAICLSAYEILTYLADRRGWTPLADISKGVMRSQPRISRLVSEMQTRGMVVRSKLHGDGRAYQINLTRKGRRVLNASSVTVMQCFDQIASGNDELGLLFSARRRESAHHGSESVIGS